MKKLLVPFCCLVGLTVMIGVGFVIGKSFTGETPNQGSGTESASVVLSPTSKSAVANQEQTLARKQFQADTASEANVSSRKTLSLDVGSAGIVYEDINLTDNFSKLHSLFKPQAGESRWMEIPWHLNIHEARKQAVAEGKPILVWSAGGSPPIGGC